MAALGRSEIVTLFVPLVLTIVAQLTSIARDTVENASDWKQPPLLLPFSKEGILPSLGRLNYLHFTNFVLLLLCFILVDSMGQDGNPLVKNLLGVMVLLVWLQLPLLEIDEYAAIRDGGRSPTARVPWSLYVHFAGTIAAAVYVVGFFPATEVLTTVDMFSPTTGALDEATHPFSQAGLVALVLVTVGGFLWQFEREVEAANREDGTGERWPVSS